MISGKKAIKIIVNAFIKLLKALLMVLILYTIIAGICALIVIDNHPTKTARTQRIFVVSNGVHLNLVLPTKTAQWDWSERLHAPNLAIAPYVYIGWGSKAFYTQVPTWSDLTLGLTAKALLLDDSVILIQGGHAPQTGHFRTIDLTDHQLQQLSADVIAQIQSLTPVQTTQSTPLSHFFPAKGQYNPLMTCNEWLRIRLRNIGLPTPLWSPFDRPVLWALPTYE